MVILMIITCNSNGNIIPYGSNHCLRRYLTPAIIPQTLPKKVLGSIGIIWYYLYYPFQLGPYQYPSGFAGPQWHRAPTTPTFPGNIGVPGVNIQEMRQTHGFLGEKHVEMVDFFYVARRLPSVWNRNFTWNSWSWDFAVQHIYVLLHKKIRSCASLIWWYLLGKI